jgi:hypothetical protein
MATAYGKWFFASIKSLQATVIDYYAHKCQLNYVYYLDIFVFNSEKTHLLSRIYRTYRESPLITVIRKHVFLFYMQTNVDCYNKTIKNTVFHSYSKSAIPVGDVGY